MVKPFSPRELVARVKSVLRRAQSGPGLSSGSTLRHGSLIINPDTPIIVYQMGKVGSRSVVASLTARGIGPVYHVHRLDPTHIERLDDSAKRQHRTGLALYRVVVEKKMPVKFITLTREPVARNISAFFHNLHDFVDLTAEHLEERVDELLATFLAKYPHSIPLRWFDQEMKTTLGIDVYQHDFDRSRGVSTISASNFDVLILKSEIDDSVKSEAISEFIDTPHLKVTRSNPGSGKRYAELYSQFRQLISLPESYLHEMYSSQYTKHFYSEKEIEEFTRAWTNPTCPPKADPSQMLGLDGHERGRNAKEEAHTRTEHHQRHHAAFRQAMDECYGWSGETTTQLAFDEVNFAGLVRMRQIIADPQTADGLALKAFKIVAK